MLIRSWTWETPLKNQRVSKWQLSNLCRQLQIIYSGCCSLIMTILIDVIQQLRCVIVEPDAFIITYPIIYGSYLVTVQTFIVLIYGPLLRLFNTKSVKRFERSNGLDTALYKNYLYLFFLQQTDNLLQQCIQAVLNLFTGSIQEIIFVPWYLY